MCGTGVRVRDISDFVLVIRVCTRRRSKYTLVVMLCLFCLLPSTASYNHKNAPNTRKPKTRKRACESSSLPDDGLSQKFKSRTTRSVHEDL